MRKNNFNFTSRMLNDGSHLHYSWYEAMHTRIDVLLLGYNTEELNDLSVKIFDILNQLELIGNRFNNRSELSRVNKIASYKSIEVSEDLFNMVSNCLEANIKTLRLFDITINSTNHTSQSISNVQLDAQSHSINFLIKDLVLDLNGYVKGYALDRIRELISTSTVKDALINLGNSSIVGIGNHPFGKGWSIGGLQGSTSDITLFDECLTTSGNITSNRRHIKHPLSHEYVTTSGTLSIITPTGTDGEVLSTSLLLANDEQKKTIIKSFGLSMDSVFS